MGVRGQSGDYDDFHCLCRGGRTGVRLGLVASLARPGGNLTGINFFNTEVTAKRLELLRVLVPAATRVAVLLNPTGPPDTETTLRDMEPAARAMGLQIQVLNASNSRDIKKSQHSCAGGPTPSSSPLPLFSQPAYAIGYPVGASRRPRNIRVT